MSIISHITQCVWNKHQLGQKHQQQTPSNGNSRKSQAAYSKWYKYKPRKPPKITRFLSNVAWEF